MVKRVIDITFSIIILLLLSPLILLIAVLILITSGKPILFRQPRLGKDAIPFDIYKFRTMTVGAPDIRNPDGSTYNVEDDPRVTPVGRFLRKTSLDELPQLINVFKGDMSLVGPRPDQVDQLQFYTEGEERKLSVKPGITGLAQINGRNTISWEQRKQLDVYYVENQSLSLDFEIFIKTIPYVLLRRDVYNPEEFSEREKSDENPLYR